VTSDISHFWCVCWLIRGDGEEMLLHIAIGVTVGIDHGMEDRVCQCVGFGGHVGVLLGR
jgi:hypothetical protein